MSQSATDHQLGQRFAQFAASRRPIELPTALSLLQDLMGADVSLLPSIRLLASQPTFLQFINAKSEAGLVPQRDELLTTAHEMLAPALATRIASFLDGYLSAGSDQAQSTPPSEPQMPFKGASTAEPSFPAVLSKSSEELPSTVVDQFAKPSSSPAAKHSSSHQGGSDQQVLLLKIALVLVVGLAAAIALFTVPSLCEPLGLCSAEEKTEEQKEREKEDAEQPDEAAETPSTPKEKAPVEPQAEQGDRNVESTGPVEPIPQSAPQRNEPLW